MGTGQVVDEMTIDRDDQENTASLITTGSTSKGWERIAIDVRADLPQAHNAIVREKS